MVREYAYCAITDVVQGPPGGDGYYHVRCSDGNLVVFSSKVKVGEGIYYTPYYENNDAVTTHGYVHSIEDLP